MNLKSRIEQVISDLKSGKLILVSDDSKRENEVDLIGIAEYINGDDINFMITHGKGLLCFPISVKIAHLHHLPLLQQSNSDGTNFTTSIDSPTSTTGISAHERFKTLKDLLKKKKVDFRVPGHAFPLIGNIFGLRKRKGHTEASLALAKLASAQEVTAIVEVVGDNGHMLHGEKPIAEFAKKHKLSHITIDEIERYLKLYRTDIWNDNGEDLNSRFQFSSSSFLPTKLGKFNIVAIRDLLSKKEYTLIYVGSIDNLNGSIGRIHSACLTAESLHSRRCDCREQLNTSLKTIQKNGKGFVLYSPDEGRGIGIFQKINAYALQDKGLDTFDANVKLNHRPDERTFEPESKIIKMMKINKIKLMSNNPRKIKSLEGLNIKVERQSIWCENKDNKKYLNTKIKKFNHIISK